MPLVENPRFGDSVFRLVFSPGKSGLEIFLREIFLYLRGFNDTDIYHSDVKMRLWKNSIFFTR